MINMHTALNWFPMLQNSNHKHIAPNWFQDAKTTTEHSALNWYPNVSLQKPEFRKSCENEQTIVGQC